MVDLVFRLERIRSVLLDSGRHIDAPENESTKNTGWRACKERPPAIGLLAHPDLASNQTNSAGESRWNNTRFNIKRYLMRPSSCRIAWNTARGQTQILLSRRPISGRLFNMNGNASYHRLQFYEVVAGPFTELNDEEDGTIALIGKENILFPEYVKEILSRYVGQRVAILRTDIKDKDYLVRVLPSDTAPANQMDSQRSQGILDDNQRL
jgi:hypothetical protein